MSDDGYKSIDQYVVQSSTCLVEGVSACRLPEFKALHGRIVVGKQLCCLVRSDSVITVHIPDPSWIRTPLSTVRGWTIIGTFSVDEGKRSMRPKHGYQALLKLIALAAIELSADKEKITHGRQETR